MFNMNIVDMRVRESRRRVNHIIDNLSNRARCMAYLDAKFTINEMMCKLETRHTETVKRFFNDDTCKC